MTAQHPTPDMRPIVDGERYQDVLTLIEFLELHRAITHDPELDPVIGVVFAPLAVLGHVAPPAVVHVPMQALLSPRPGIALSPRPGIVSMPTDSTPLKVESRDHIQGHAANESCERLGERSSHVPNLDAEAVIIIHRAKERHEG